MNSLIKKLQQLIDDSSKITVITGAGISTSCGIPDFRGPGGLYSRKDIDASKIFDIEYFYRDPEYFYSIMKNFFMDCLRAEPSPAHRFISLLEEKEKLDLLITQNIDGLHEKAGNRKIIRAHGSFDTMICRRCGKKSASADSSEYEKTPLCVKCGSVLKPDVVFFGESIKGMDESIDSAASCDLLLGVGTSFTVYPVASLPRFRKPETPFVIINIGPTSYDDECNLKIEDDINAALSSIRL